MNAQEHLQPWCHRALGGLCRGLTALLTALQVKGRFPTAPLAPAPF